MYVCVCNVVTDSDIRNAVDGGARNLKQLRQVTGCGTACGSCKEMTLDILQESLAKKREPQEFLMTMQLA